MSPQQQQKRNLIHFKFIEVCKKGKDIWKTPFRLTVNSYTLCQDLEKYGIVPRKSLILKFPNNISDEMLPHIIRGYFDGDGSISCYKRKYKDAEASEIDDDVVVYEDLATSY